MSTVKYPLAVKLGGTGADNATDARENLGIVDTPVAGLQYFGNANGDAYLGSSWLKCVGQILNQADYPELFDRIGFVNGPFTNFLTTTTFTNQNIQSVIYDGTRFVATGTLGILGTSTDAQNWTSSTTGQASTVLNLTYNGSVYAGNVNQFVITSTNLATWTLSAAVVNATAARLAYGGNKYGFLTGSGMLMRSTDSMASWRTRTPMGRCLLYTDKLVQLANGISLNSTDNLDWVYASFPTVSMQNDLIYANSLYVAGGVGGTINTSTDFVTWTARTLGVTTTVNAISYGNSIYAAGLSNGNLRTSTNAITWASTSTLPSAPIYDIAFNGSIFAISAQGAQIYTTTDFVTNTPTATLTPNTNYTTLSYLNSLWTAGGVSGNLQTSTDAITWNNLSTISPVSSITSLNYLNGIYLIGCANGNIFTSTDLITTTLRSTGLTTSSIYSIVYTGSIYYASSDNITVTSTDAITWTQVTNLPVYNATYSNLNFLNNVFAIPMSNGRLLTSTDLITWSDNNTGSGVAITALTYGAGKWVTGFQSGALRTSTNLSSWITTTTVTSSSIQSLFYGNSLFLLYAGSTTLKTSTDATQWDQVTSNITSTILTMAASPNAISLAGISGAVGYSLNVYPYDENTQFQLPTDAQAPITNEFTSNFRRNLYIKALPS